MRDLVEYGFVSYTGKKWSDNQVDQYNLVQKRINSWLAIGSHVPVELLNASHKLMWMFSQ